MAKTRRRNGGDDDDNPALDENGLLRDGHSVRVSLMDAMSVRDQRPLLHDGKGGVPGRRPGFAFNRDAYAKDELEVAYCEYEERLCDAWRHADAEGFQPGSEGCVCTTQNEFYPEDFGSLGHVKYVNGKGLICVPDTKSSSAADHATTMDAIYELYDEDLRNQWRRP